MTNLERAAALAAERGWVKVETYRGWDVYETDGEEWRHMLFSPHEMSGEQHNLVCRQLWPESTSSNLGACGARHRCEEITHVYGTIDRWEAAREAMPASAFFRVEVEAL